MITKLEAKLGQPDSNWRLQESKSCALPLGDGPKFHAAGNPVHMFSCLVRRKKSFASKRLEGGYRDSNPGPPEPQSGALTNCAIPTIKQNVLEGIRTPDPRLRRPLLYPTELLTQIKAGDGNRTHVSSLEGWCSTIEPHLHISL